MLIDIPSLYVLHPRIGCQKVGFIICIIFLYVDFIHEYMIIFVSFRKIYEGQYKNSRVSRTVV